MRRREALMAIHVVEKFAWENDNNKNNNEYVATPRECPYYIAMRALYTDFG